VVLAVGCVAIVFVTWRQHSEGALGNQAAPSRYLQLHLLQGDGRQHRAASGRDTHTALDLHTWFTECGKSGFAYAERLP
jgi:hypothetical protein